MLILSAAMALLAVILLLAGLKTLARVNPAAASAMTVSGVIRSLTPQGKLTEATLRLNLEEEEPTVCCMLPARWRKRPADLVTVVWTPGSREVQPLRSVLPAQVQLVAGFALLAAAAVLAAFCV